MLTGTVAGDPVAQSVSRGRQAGGAAGRSPSSGTVDLLGIDFYPSSPLPFLARWQGFPTRGQPLFCWVSSTQKKGFREVAWGCWPPRAPAL